MTLIVFRRARTPPGGTIRDPSKFCTPPTLGVGVVAATAVVNKPEAVGKSAVSKTTRLLVKPVSAVAPPNDLTEDPACDNVLRLHGTKPVLITALLIDPAQTKAPSATDVALLIKSCRAACVITALMPLVSGFQSPTIGVVVAVSVTVFAVSASTPRVLTE